jgi:hypothetical protein
MQTKFRKMLPKTIYEIPNGGIYKQAVRCGKSNCKCARGEKHSAYYFFTRRDGKLSKTYIRKAELENFKQLVDRAAADRNEERRMDRDTNALIKRLRQSMREKDQFIKDLKNNNT